MKDAFGKPIAIGDEIIVVTAQGGYTAVGLVKGKVTKFGNGERQPRLAYEDLETDESWFMQYRKEHEPRQYSWTFPHRVVVIRYLSWDD